MSRPTHRRIKNLSRVHPGSKIITEVMGADIEHSVCGDDKRCMINVSGKRTLSLSKKCGEKMSTRANVVKIRRWGTFFGEPALQNERYLLSDRAAKNLYRFDYLGSKGYTPAQISEMIKPFRVTLTCASISKVNFLSNEQLEKLRKAYHSNPLMKGGRKGKPAGKRYELALEANRLLQEQKAEAKLAA